MDGGGVTDAERSNIVDAARAVVGDELRSVAYFTAESLEQLYLRADLDRSADLVGFAENERMGFRSQSTYSGSELGEYRFTIRGFERGYLTRVIAGDHGVWVTTDPMAIDRFEELASALTAVLDDLST